MTHIGRFLARFSRGEYSLTRTEAFSDAVFAIIVTLLVLDLKVPHLHDVDSVGELAGQLAALAPKFVSWLISFIIVCKFWLNHHHLLSLARHANYGMMWLNSLFLLGQSFIPFPTALAGEYPHNALAVSAFGAVFALNTLLFLLLNAYIRINLIKPELAAAQDPHAIVKGLIGPASYLVGAALAWANIYAAFAVYALTPLFYITPWDYRGAQKRRSPRERRGE
jgi:TMEM175 potassium channel family protein